ncbi:MAG: protein tyrosine phosphatase [Nevskia sp.]|nr:protein tyrosine phosphatase [Nevskia sp.]
MRTANPPPRLPRPSAWQRLRFWLNALFVDHAIFRLFYNTRRALAPDFFRSGHPLPYQLRSAARAGVKSVLNLRGAETHIGSNRLEWLACEALDMPVLHLPLGSRSAPHRDEVLALIDLFESMPRPLLVHCKSGADRAGMASVIFLITQKGMPLEQALHELDFWKHGHIRQAKTGVLDHFFETYRAYRDAHGTDFQTWVRDIYDRDAVERSFHSNWWANQLVDFVLRRE